MCIGNCKVCDKLQTSNTITVNADTVEVNLIQNGFINNQLICLLLMQNFPTDATIDSPVAITLSTDTTQYPIVDRNGVPVYITQLRTRTMYPLRVRTTPTGGVFVMQRCLPNSNVTVSDSIPVATVTNTETTKEVNADA